MNAKAVLAVGLITVFTVGCAGVKTRRYALEPAPNSCQASETRASAFSTITAVICWDADGKVIGMASTGGQPVASVATAIIGAAGTVAGAAIIGGAIAQVGQSLERSRLVPENVRLTVTAPQAERLEDLAAGAVAP